MVRVFLKGGVWKNSEDEILKAAVQKYGKQQWARVASLLNRKTAKQAKARWHEWLDPAIRKVEWSLQEEEKLLHLAKLMPSQWKTIAATIGRTATQCQEHYEYLLDQAAAANAGEAGGTNSDQLLLRSSAQLRAGQIDSHPESKPARPDPIDMDEDEMEMLQEARARLANTQGKKAKRKQRERMLVQAKRLADLQKRRELKQAGLLSKAAAKNSKLSKRNIDLGVEIPFHKPAPAGFHDVSTENAIAEAERLKRWKKIDAQKINEMQYNTRNREMAALRKKEESRLRILQESNEKYSKMAKQQQEEDNVPVRALAARGPLQLPEPTITDSELVQLAKLQQSQQAVSTEFLEGGSGATQALLSDYSDLPLPSLVQQTQVAASSTVSRQQTIMYEATQLRKLERGTTPLLVQNQKEEDDEEEDDMDRKPAARPNPSSSNQSVVTNRTSLTNRTPATRDRLGLNSSSSIILNDDDSSPWVTTGSRKHPPPADSHQDLYDSVSLGASTFASSKYSIRDLARQQRRAAKRARQELEAAFAALPAPQYEYELAVPTVSDMEEDDSKVPPSLMDADRADLEAAEQERLRQEAAKLYEARNSVLKRTDLPRPPSTPMIKLPIELSQEQLLIQQEMDLLIQHDSKAFPVLDNEMENKKVKKEKKGKKRKPISDSENENDEAMALSQPVHLEVFPENALDQAKQLIQQELEVILEEKVASVLNAGKASNRQDALIFMSNENSRISLQKNDTLVYTKSGGWVETKTKNDIIQSFQDEFDTLQEATAALKKKNDKIESKLKVMTGGYTKRAAKLTTDIQQTFHQIQDSQIQRAVYVQLYQQETAGIRNRISTLQTEISRLKQVHLEKQRLYGDLVVQKRRLVKIAASKG